MKFFSTVLFLLIVFSNYSFAKVKTVKVSCDGIIKVTGGGSTESEIFYDDLEFWIVDSKKQKKIILSELDILSSSHPLNRPKTWQEKKNILLVGSVLNFSQGTTSTSDGDVVNGFRGSLNLDTGRYSGSQSIKGTWSTVSWSFVAQCNTNKVLAALNPDQKKDDGKSGGSSGTAFLINNKGNLLTNHHVVDGCKVSKIFYQDQEYKTNLIATDKTLDLALLKADLKNTSFINFSNSELKKMQKIYVAGYPLGKGLSDDLKISSGIISSLKGFKDNSNEIQIDAPINPGNSGGPIINENGDLVAIAVSGLSKDKTEGINFGIKVSAVDRFLNSNGLKPNSSIFSTSKNNDQLLNILEKSTVYTYCD